MRLTHIRNPLKRRQWEEFIETAHGKLRAENIDLRFRTVKNDGSAARASTVLPAVYFAFGQDWGRKWVELELRPRTVGGARRPQKELYAFLKSNLCGRIPVFQHRLSSITQNDGHFFRHVDGLWLIELTTGALPRTPRFF